MLQFQFILFMGKQNCTQYSSEGSPLYYKMALILPSLYRIFPIWYNMKSHWQLIVILWSISNTRPVFLNCSQAPSWGQKFWLLVHKCMQSCPTEFHLIVIILVSRLFSSLCISYSSSEPMPLSRFASSVNFLGKLLYLVPWSLMNIVSKTSPKTDSWGTPLLIFH